MTSGTIEMALRELHHGRGAAWTVDGTIEVPARYGDLSVEIAALRQGLALWDASAAGILELTGDDRHRFLNGQVTADVLELKPGSSRYGLLPTLKGRVLSDVTVIVDDDRILLRLPPGRAEAIRQHMEKYIITDRVELALRDDVLPIVLAGPATEARLVEWLGSGTLPGERGAHAAVTVLNSEVLALREQRLGTPAVSLWVAEADAEQFVNALLAEDEPPVLVGHEAIEAVRVAGGIPRFGVDFGDDTFPQEAALDEAVSYEKGCYLGQEVIARIHFRGGVNRILRGLRFDTGADLTPGTAVVADGREAGHLTSVTPSGPDGPFALAMLAASVEAGDRVELDGGVTVGGVTIGVVTGEVVELPLSGES